MRGLLKKIITYILLLFLIAPAFSQQKRSVSMRQQIQREMKMARFLVQEHPDAEAEAWLRQAEELQQEATNLLRMGRAPAARKKARDAQDFVQRVIKKLSGVHLASLGRQVKELQDRAELVIPDSRDKEAIRLLKQSRINLNKARNESQGGDYRKTFELLRMARFQAERSLRLVEENTDDIDLKLESEKNRFDNLIGRVENLLSNCKDNQAQKLYRQVVDQQPSISEALEAGDKFRALDLYYSSTRLLLRAIDLCQGMQSSVQEQAEQEVALLENLINAADMRNLENGQGRRRNELEPASKQRDEALVALSNENYEQALQYAQNGINLLNRPQNKNGKELRRPGSRLMQELERLDAEINKFKNSAKVNNDRQRALLEAAESCSRDADEFLNSSDDGLALQSILAGHRMLLKAESPQNSATLEYVHRRFESLQKSIEQARQGASDYDVALLIQAERAAMRAQNEIAAGHPDSANEYLRLGEDILKLEKP